jgi:predicted RNase H-like HicB family nuclease
MGLGGIVSSTLAADNGVSVMTPHAVKLQVEAKVPKDCIFWLEADGWTGICEDLSVTVQGISFEDVKRAMEAALQEHIKTVLRENTKTTAPQAA